jgi:hypothetical protein
MPYGNICYKQQNQQHQDKYCNLNAQVCKGYFRQHNIKLDTKLCNKKKRRLVVSTSYKFSSIKYVQDTKKQPDINKDIQHEYGFQEYAYGRHKETCDRQVNHDR